ncbi:hypothetical protein DCC81_06040 [Chitinophaga parva]|uniref:Uncharacterized protein n=1 Tax=Chitinophaga parva TaxID=2169414 RepID=A0A2T7BMX1_9BACT|nr:hypothetical protein DCC81_06040 [Chitinophaga parva]
MVAAGSWNTLQQQQSNIMLNWLLMPPWQQCCKFQSPVNNFQYAAWIFLHQNLWLEIVYLEIAGAMGAGWGVNVGIFYRRA